MKHNKASALRTGLFLSAAAGLGLGLLVSVGAGSASATPINTTVDYSCAYPLIGARDLKVNISTDIPAQVQAGVGTPTIRVDASSTISADTTDGLNAIGGATLEGIASAHVTVTSADYPNGLPANVRQTLEKVSVPGSGAFNIRSFGTRAPLTFASTGPVTITLGDLDLQVTPKKADGTATGMGTFQVKCTQVGQSSTTLATMQVVSNPVDNPPVDLTPPTWLQNQPPPDLSEPVGTLHYDLNLNGSTFVKGPNGTAPINGSIGVNVDGATGAINGPLSLAPTTGNFNIMGFLPVTTQIAFVQSGNTTGTYANGQINTKSTMTVKYASFNAFGAIPIGGGADCGTTAPMDVLMHSTAGAVFNPYKGGPFNADNYTLPGIQNCGSLNDIISLFEAGPGNTITAKLSPKS